MQQQVNNNAVGLDKLIDDRIKAVLPIYLSGNAFTQRKVTDTPNDSLEVVNRKFVTLNGAVADRPTSSVAVIGQTYFATDTNIPMTYSSTGWRNGVGSIVAQA
jgi:hypothetical protein